VTVTMWRGGSITGGLLGGGLLGAGAAAAAALVVGATDEQVVGVVFAHRVQACVARLPVSVRHQRVLPADGGAVMVM
jgi:hypothetical protein